MISRLLTTTLTLLTAATLSLHANDQKTVVMIAGKPSHAPGQHEHNAGIKLFDKCLKQANTPIKTIVHLNGEWPSPETLASADSIVIYSDGGANHPALQNDHLSQLQNAMDRGAGLVLIHYAVEPTLENGNKQFIDWIGGCFEINWSVNPHWQANFKNIPQHPVSNGVKPFSSNDEWYFHMRFRPNMKGVTPILSDAPPESTMARADGPHSGNPTVRQAVASKTPQHLAWASERDNGGRGFGFTGGHFHSGWGNDSQRKLILNAILWTAKAQVPTNGVETTLEFDELKKNLDTKNVRRR